MKPRLRIIAGTHRGVPLEVPPLDLTRPITDRAKEALFSILGHRFGTLGMLPPFDVLDLFSGSGSLGIEALSRGAAHCTFVERDGRALNVLRANLARTRFQQRAALLRHNAWTMRLPESASGGFGLVFVDPPYRDSLDERALEDLLERIAVRLAPSALVVWRGGERTRVPERVRGLVRVDERRFREMLIVIYEAPPAAPAAEPPDLPSPQPPAPD